MFCSIKLIFRWDINYLALCSVFLLHFLGTTLHVYLGETTPSIFFVQLAFSLVFFCLCSLTSVRSEPADVESCPLSTGAPPLRFCNKCQHYQVYRCKHCIHCNKCIDKYDHHCMWLGTCIGRRNHLYFLVFLVFEFLILKEFVKRCLVSALEGPDLFNFSFRFLNFILYLGFLLVCIISSFLLMMVAGLFFFNLFLIVTNQTSWELFKRDRITYLKDLAFSVRPFDRGVLRNVLEFLVVNFKRKIWDITNYDSLKKKDDVDEDSSWFSWF
ncbi:hypothetical protein P9112_012074 [Eukaryota sp. TZLM1-RC]